MGRLVTQTYSSIRSKRHAYVWGSIRLVIALASTWIIESRVTSKCFLFNQYWGFDFASQLQASAQYCQSHLEMKIAHSTSFYEWECVGGVGEKHRKTIRKKVGNIADKLRTQIENIFETNKKCISVFPFIWFLLFFLDVFQFHSFYDFFLKKF